MTTDREMHPILRLASQRPFMTSLTGTVLLLLCFPPVGWWPLAWVALVPFIALIATPTFEAARPMRSIWISGLLYWAAEAYYISIPHPALFIAWIMLFVYLSVYPVLFVWIGRKLVQGQRVPVLIAAPLVFTALEWARAHMLTGFGFSMLANSQYQVPIVLQVCDLAGAYGLTFLMVAFAAGLFLFITTRRIANILVSAAMLALIIGYGLLRLGNISNIEGDPLDVVVVQGNIDTRFPTSQHELDEYQKQQFTEYLELQTRWQRENDWPVPELIIWPEGKYPIPHLLPGGGEEQEEIRRDFRRYYRMLYQDLVENKKWNRQPRLPTMIVGTNTMDPTRNQAFNSALLLGNQGNVLSTYHKMHLVPFGEFVPFVEWFPVLARMTPIGSGFDAGERAVGFNIGKYVGAPNICFESAVTHLIRESVVQLRSMGKEPHFIVNITDDGWFFGHAVLDHHLACNVMRAVENRKPLIVAGNTGISAFIQSTGEILKQGPRRKSEVLEMEFELKPGRSWYSVIGDWPEIFMLIICVLAIVIPPRKKPKPTVTNEEKT